MDISIIINLSLDDTTYATENFICFVVKLEAAILCITSVNHMLKSLFNEIVPLIIMED